MVLLTPSTAAAVPTATTLSSSANPSVAGQAVTFTATVSSDDPLNVPDGTMTFSVDGTAAPAVALAAGQATLQTNGLAPGTHEIRAAYTPGPSFDPSEATPLSQTVAKALTTTTLEVEPATAVAGEPVTLTATVAPQPPGTLAPTGTVRFEEVGQAPIDTVALAGDGTATLQVAGPAGDHSLRAVYSGDASHEPSEALAGHHIGRAATATTLTSTPNPVAPGGAIEFLAVVDVLPPGDWPKFGSLQFFLGGAPFGPALPLDGLDGYEVTVTAPPTPGSATVDVMYSGDQNTLESQDSLVQTVSAPAPPAAGGGSAPPPPPAAGRTSRSLLRGIAAQLRSRLAKQGVAALRKARFSFTAVEPGTFTERVLAKRVLVASARKRFTVPGKQSFRLRLTKAGKRIARSRKPPKLSIVARFAPTSGAPTTVTVTLRPKARKARWRIVAATAVPWGAALRRGPQSLSTSG